MIMRKYYRGGTKGQGRTENLTGLKRGDIQTADRHPLAADRLVSCIEVKDGKALPHAGPEILKLKKRLARPADDRSRAIRRDMPAPGQLPDRKQASNLARTKAMAPSR